MSRSERVPSGVPMLPRDPCSQLDDLELCAASYENKTCDIDCDCYWITVRARTLLQDAAKSADVDSVAHNCMMLEKAQVILAAIACKLLRGHHRPPTLESVLTCFEEVKQSPGIFLARCTCNADTVMFALEHWVPKQMLVIWCELGHDTPDRQQLVQTGAAKLAV